MASSLDSCAIWLYAVCLIISEYQFKNCIAYKFGTLQIFQHSTFDIKSWSLLFEEKNVIQHEALNKNTMKVYKLHQSEDSKRVKQNHAQNNPNIGNHRREVVGGEDERENDN